MLWFCKGCRPTVMATMKEVKKLRAENKELKQMIEELREANNTLVKEMKGCEASIVQKATEKVMEQLREEEDKKKRKKILYVNYPQNHFFCTLQNNGKDTSTREI